MEKVIFQLYPHFIKRMNYFYEQNEEIKDCNILLLGDSLIEMFPHEKLSEKYSVVNRGIVSDKTHGVMISLDDRVFPLKPSLIFIFVGSNDICDGYLNSTIINNYENIIRLLKNNNPNIKIICSSIIPPCYYPAEHVDMIYPNCRDILKIKDLNEKLKKLASTKNITFFDSFSLLADEKESLRADHTLDGVHLTLDAYQILIDNLKPIIDKMMEE